MSSHTELRRNISCSDRDHFLARCPEGTCLTVVVAGASGDLAKKKTFPALQFLFDNGFLPDNTRIIGYARSDLKDEDLRERLRGYLTGDDESKAAFLSLCTYISGPYDTGEGFKRLSSVLVKREGDYCHSCPIGRLYYLALPPSAYPQACSGLKSYCDSFGTSPAPEGSWIRLIVEKPFGRDLGSSEELSNQLGELYPESQLFRIDHYLGKEMSQSLLVVRFANSLLTPVWDRGSIANVQITFKEDFGTGGRGGYFDQFGIIRDVIQNHLMQLLAHVAMEKPISRHPDDIRDEKVKVLRCIRSIRNEDVVLGQYSAVDGSSKGEGYLDDETVPKGSRTPTFASIVLYIDNDRWSGVPFILKAGKALDERKAEIRIQLRSTPHFVFEADPEEMRNEIVVRLQPNEAIYAKLIVKSPGLDTHPVISDLDLTLKHRHPTAVIPDAYPKLILDAIRGDQQHFVRRDELRAAWAIITPLLEDIDSGKLPLHDYPHGSRGPARADEILKKVGFVKNRNYKWK